ncbi:TolC family protein [Nitrincola alkalisediminis]|uniref:TolC family protein n=1 Tax=Nitrincola alkalisediminis TaxID=1366656 RepID=UPI0018760A1E|nr:TolC family protein [Nitrincola alkalisediminis]
MVNVSNRFGWTSRLLALLCVSGVSAVSAEESVRLALDEKFDAQQAQTQQILHAPEERLADLMREALSQHPNIRVSQAELQAAQDDREAAEWGRFPSVGLDSQWRSGGLQSTARIEQPLWTGGRIQGNIDFSEARENDARAGVMETQLKLLEDTASAFFEILRLQSRIAIAKENERELETLLGTIERRVRAEINPVADQTLASSRLYQAQADVQVLMRQLRVVRSRLNQLVNREVFHLVTPQTFELVTVNEPWVADRVVSYSPTRERLLTQVQQGRADIAITRAQSLPSVVLGHEQRVGKRASGEDSSRSYVGLQMQLDSGLANFSRVKAAHARLDAATDRIQVYERELRTTIDSLQAEIDTLEQQIPATQNMLAAAELIVESYLRQFHVGRKSWLDVLNAQREKAQAQALLADLQAPLELAKLRLLLLSGDINENTLGRLDEY